MTLRAFVARMLALAALLSATGIARGDDLNRSYRSIDTPHFHIVYYTLPNGKGLEEVAQRTAVIAEETHARLLPYLGPGLSKHRKTWVVITDDTDDYNGSATVLPYPVVRLNATTPDERAEHNDFDDWLGALFVHEYTHILHIGTIGGACAAIVNAVTGFGLGLTYAPNQVQPRFLIEGLAVFEESERTSGGRLRSSIWDMYLRAQTLEGRFQRLDQFTHTPIQFPFANSAYLYGSALMRFVANKYGQNVLRDEFKDYGSNCLPAAINRSLRRQIGKTWIDVYDEFRVELKRKYTAQRDSIAARGITPTRRLTGPREVAARPVFLPDGNEFLWLDSDGYSRPAIRRMNANTGAWHGELMVDAAGGVDLSADGRTMVYHAVEPWLTYYYFNDLFLFDRVTRERRRLTYGLRATNPGISADGKWIAFEINDAASRGLGLYDVANEKWETLLPAKGFEIVYTPRFSPDGKTIAFSWWKESGYRDIWTMDLATRKLTQITHDRSVDMEPRYSPDGRYLYFVSDRNEVHNLYAHELSTGKIFQATNVVNGVFDPAISPDGKRLAFIGFAADGYVVETAALDPATWWEAAPALLDRPDEPPLKLGEPLKSKRYNPLRTIFPWTFSLFAQPDGYGELLGVRVSGGDVVGHHAWSLSLGFGTGRADDVNFSANYAYRGMWPSLNFGVGHSLARRNGLVVNGVDLGYDEDNWSVGTSVGLPILRKATQSSDLSFSYSASFTSSLTKIPPPDPNALVPRYPQTGRVAGLGLGWSYSNLRRYTYSVSTEQGRELSLYVGLGSKYLGSRYEVYSISWHWAEYFPMPWKPKPLRSHVLWLSYSGGLSGGDLQRRGLYFLGGYPSQNLLTSIYDFSRPGSASLRGYPYGSEGGDQFHVINLEYRFPITWIEWGYKTTPLYFRRLHGKVFADYGGAFFGAFSFDKIKLGVGAEVMLELTYAWYFPAALQLGYAHGVHAGGGDQVYFLLNNPF